MVRPRLVPTRGPYRRAQEKDLNFVGSVHQRGKSTSRCQTNSPLAFPVDWTCKVGCPRSKWTYVSNHEIHQRTVARQTVCWFSNVDWSLPRSVIFCQVLGCFVNKTQVFYEHKNSFLGLFRFIKKNLNHKAYFNLFSQNQKPLPYRWLSQVTIEDTTQEEKRRAFSGCFFIKNHWGLF